MFRMFDVNGDGFVDKTDLLIIYRMIFGFQEHNYQTKFDRYLTPPDNRNISEDLIVEMVDSAIRMADADHDGKLSRSDFENVRNWLGNSAGKSELSESLTK